MADARIFTRMTVFNRIQGGTLVTWEIDPRVSKVCKAPYTFYVYGSKSGVGDWEPIATAGANNWYVVDTARHLYAMSPRYAYFVRMKDADDHYYDSDVRHVMGNLSALQDPGLRKMLQNERLGFRKGGSIYLLYKRRWWGTPCPVCKDFDTGDSVGGNQCTTCYGTTFTGGYFDPLALCVGASVRAQTQPRLLKIDDGIGTSDEQKTYVKAIACPWMDTRDVMVNMDSDIRYQIRRLHPIDYRSITVMYDPIELVVVPTTDIIYRLPRPDSLIDPMPTQLPAPSMTELLPTARFVIPPGMRLLVTDTGEVIVEAIPASSTDLASTARFVIQPGMRLRVTGTGEVVMEKTQ